MLLSSTFCLSSLCHFSAFRDVTGKSMLLQSIREINKNGNKNLNKYTTPAYLVRGDKADPTCSHESHHLGENSQSSHLHLQHKNPKMEILKTAQQSTVKEPKQQRYAIFLYSFSTLTMITNRAVLKNQYNNLSQYLF